MGTWSQNHEKMQKNLRTKLAVAVRSIQWSYGIFWSSSTSKEGVLEWSDGYYNGDIKTTKTVQSTELLKADKIGLQRSEQLRELYNFLHEAETDTQAKRPSAALSPEDLTDLEWYYLVCMSFEFKPNESLPGRALESGETIWLCDAQYADSKIFSRSLLAKSASIQTVVCFPYLEGVIEIGTNEMVSEDPNLIQHVKACFLDFLKPICSDKSLSALNKVDDDDDKDPTCTKVDQGILSTMDLHNLCFSQEEINFDQEYPIDAMQEDNNQDFNMGSPNECSDGCEHQGQIEDSITEVINGGSPQVNCQSFLDDGFSTGVQDSFSSGYCISDAFENQDEAYKKASRVHLKEIQDCNHSKLSSLDIGAVEDLHYTRTLSAVLGNSSMFKENLSTNNFPCKSSFVKWKKGEISERLRTRGKQSMLKKILFNVPFMHSSGSSLKSKKENDQTEWHNKLEKVDNCMRNVLSDKMRESVNFQVLKSMVPSINEVDKTSIVGDTIKYLKELEARVEELESCMDISDYEAKTRRKQPEVLEQISDNYETGKTYKGKKPLMNKRKASDVDAENKKLSSFVLKDGKPLEVKVKMKDQEVSIEMKCPYREYILLDIMDAINNLYLDAHTVQSVTVDGVLTLTLKSKVCTSYSYQIQNEKSYCCSQTGCTMAQTPFIGLEGRQLHHWG